MTFLQLPLSVLQATAFSAFFAGSYVGSLYLSKNARLSFSTTAVGGNCDAPRERQKNERWRDDPDVIRARLLAVSLATIAACTVVIAVADTPGLRLGVFAPHPPLAHLVTPLLFLGPLYAMFLQQTLPLQARFSPAPATVITARNIIVAPLTEEIVFRACILAVYHLCAASRTKMIFLSPLWFGLAHAHHGWDIYNRYGRSPAALQRAATMTLFQLAYTTLFGFHCCYLFLRTGSILPPITAHMFCNTMGVPQLSYEMRILPKRKTFILLAYVLGVVVYVYTLGAWTRTEDSIYWLDDSTVE